MILQFTLSFIRVIDIVCVCDIKYRSFLSMIKDLSEKQKN